LVIGSDGNARYLEGTGTGPLGTGSPPVLASSALAPGELVLLYSDGLIERPDRTVAEGMAELAVVAAGAAADRSLAPDADLAAARPGRRGPRPRPDGGRARRGQAAGQPPGRALHGNYGDAAAPAAPARRAGPGPVRRARRARGRAAANRGHLRGGGRHGPGAG